MTGTFNFHNKDAVKVKVKKCEGLFQPEYRKFSVDPEITSFVVMQSLLARAFDVKGEFTISYLGKDDNGQETYFSLLSDWDLDAAFLGASSPCLRLKVDLKPFEEGLEDWDILAPADFSFSNGQQTKDRSTIAGSILNQMEKTLSIFQRALNLVENQTMVQPMRPLKLPMNDAEFHNYLDSDGRLVMPNEFRLSIYKGGLEPGLRKVVWKHILNVYPEGLSGAERVDYMKRLSKGYYTMRDIWQKATVTDDALEDMNKITNMVQKDVQRTDRTHKFFAGSDDNENVTSLSNILITFALNHPSVTYCQGMSDLASPLLVTMVDEAHAYVCFCAIMKRLKPNFLIDGKAMSTKFQHLTEALQIYDPTFYDYLLKVCAGDLLFCYRWILLELKREFAFDDALRMLEVLWSSLPHCPPEAELDLFEPLTSPSTRPKSQNKGNHYATVRALRRQSSSSSCNSLRSLSKSSPQVSLQNDCGDAPGKDKPSPLARPSNDDNTLAAGSNPKPTSSHHDHRHPIVKQSSFQETDMPNKLLPDYLPLNTPASREVRMDMEGQNRQLTGTSHLRGGGTTDSEDLESPVTTGQATLMEENEEEDGETSSSDSEKASTGDHIRCGASVKKKRKEPIAAERSEAFARTYDHAQAGLFRFNGEIFPHVDDDEDDVVFDASADVPHHSRKMHLKNIVPIRFMRDSSSRKVDNSQTFGHCSKTRNVSGGYATMNDAKKCAASIELDDGTASSLPMTNSCEEALEIAPDDMMSSSQMACSSLENSLGSFVAPPGPIALRGPEELGCGNPFMIFLCLTLLMQHRDHIMKNHMDYNELAIHFDKMVRRHDVTSVLHQARTLFTSYMKERNWEESVSEGSTECRDQHV